MSITLIKDGDQSEPTARVNGVEVAISEYREPGTSEPEPPPEGAVAVTWPIHGFLDNGHRVRFHVAEECTVGLVYSTSAALTSPTSVAGTLNTTTLIADVTVTGLSPETTYYAKALTDNVASGPLMSWTTLPNGAGDFSVVFGSCSNTPLAVAPVWTTIADAEPSMFIHAGDWGYDDPNHDSTLTVEEARGFWTSKLPSIAPMLETVPIEYMPDGHDHSAYWEDRTPQVNEIILDRIKENMPHRPFPAEGMYRAFTVGRVRFIITDTQTFRDDPYAASSSTKSKLGLTQRAWLLDELSDAQSVHGCLCTIWVTTHPFAINGGVERWGSYNDERAIIRDHITSNGLASRLQEWAGDRHYLAMDSGINNPWGGHPFLISAPLAFNSNTQGTVTIEQGPFRSGSYFTYISFEDDGTNVTVNWSGRSSSTGEEVCSDNFVYTPLT